MAEAHLLALVVDKLDAMKVHGKNEIVGIGPEAFVVHVEERATIERVVLHRGKVPHLCLDLRLSCPIFLKGGVVR